MLSLKEWIRMTYGSQSAMDRDMGWGKRTTSRFVTREPWRFFQYRHEISQRIGLDPFELHRMIDQREREILAGQKLRDGGTEDEALSVLPHRETSVRD